VQSAGRPSVASNTTGGEDAKAAAHVRQRSAPGESHPAHRAGSKKSRIPI